MDLRYRKKGTKPYQTKTVKFPGTQVPCESKFLVQNLAANTVYQYELNFGIGRPRKGTFRTAPTQNKRTNIRVALSSCMDVAHWPSRDDHDYGGDNSGS